MGLIDYAQANPPQQGSSGCWCCVALSDEQLAELNAGLRGDIEVPLNVRVIVGWLQNDEGLTEATPAKVRYHKERGHHVLAG